MTHTRIKGPEGPSPQAAHAVAAIAAKAFASQLGTITRADLDSHSAVLTRHLRAYLDTPGEHSCEDGEFRRQAAALLAATPGPRATAFSLHAHMRDLAHLLRRLNGMTAESEGDGGIRSSRPFARSGRARRFEGGTTAYDVRRQFIGSAPQVWVPPAEASGSLKRRGHVLLAKEVR
ncbi:hypothetical protein SLA_1873 [Streptomyces laurentii]|uniref:Uncharacterized protein n=1 Tax=Streptomyces laurentii TaxID=39478 RepID=A0A160NY45_STRLU|nr:hypothetical protein SLA_1873 [Streptomyces laurentii]